MTSVSSLCPFVIALASLLFASSSRAEEPKPRSADATSEVSIVALIANPDQFDGRRVEVRAWGLVESAQAAGAIFITKEDADYENVASAIHLFGATDVPSFEGYMKVAGRFRAGQHLLFPGSIEVEKIVVLKPTARGE